MAFQFPATKSGATYYSVDYTVGRSGMNRKDDVILIQTMLNIQFFDLGGTYLARDWSAYECEPLPHMERLKIDGLAGPKTKEAILVFQRKLARFVPMMKGHDDGDIGPLQMRMRPSDSDTWKMVKGRTMILLNDGLIAHDRANSTTYHPKVGLELNPRKDTVSQYHLGLGFQKQR